MKREIIKKITYITEMFNLKPINMHEVVKVFRVKDLPKILHFIFALTHTNLQAVFAKNLT